MFFYGMIENGLKNPLDQHGYSSFASKPPPGNGHQRTPHPFLYHSRASQ
jgi:hypothetical protein